MAIYQFKEIKMLHLEVTSKCNAGCPMCARNVQGGPVNTLLPLTELSLDQVKVIFSPDFIQQLNKVYLCGNYGDPIMAKDCLPILEYFREVSPTVNMGLHTNGGTRPLEFWQGLAKVVSYCRFGIDGLRDTNHLYRQNIKWDVLERNVRSFIDAGGYAEWDFLVFKHNEHQVEEARTLAKEWGIKSFNVKATSRFFSSQRQNIREKVPVHNFKGEHTHNLEQANKDQFRNSFYEEQENIIKRFGSLQSYWDRSAISCKVSQEKSLYVSAQGWAFPCCWVGNEVYSKHIHSSQNQVLQMIDSLPEQSGSLDAIKNKLQDVVEGVFFQSALENSWGKKSVNEGKLKVCARTCGQELRPFENQFL